MELRKINSKRGAIELSIGTVVIIVLAMSMLILGIVLIRNIFSTATSSITEIDQGVKSEINKLFSENSEKTLVLYPDSGIIQVERGEGGQGFAISLHNTLDDKPDTFDYEVESTDYSDCGTDPVGDTVTMIGAKEDGIGLAEEAILENPRHVRLTISEAAPICTFRLTVRVDCVENPVCNSVATSASMDVEIVPR
jgi:hypothetical protein